QKTGDWPPNNLTAANDASVCAGELYSISIEQLNDSRRRARNEARPPHGEQTYIRRMECVHIFRWIDCLDDESIVYLFGQRQLNQDSVSRIVSVQSVHDIQ